MVVLDRSQRLVGTKRGIGKLRRTVAARARAGHRLRRNFQLLVQQVDAGRAKHATGGLRVAHVAGAVGVDRSCRRARRGGDRVVVVTQEPTDAADLHSGTPAASYAAFTITSGATLFAYVVIAPVPAVLPPPMLPAALYRPPFWPMPAKK